MQLSESVDGRWNRRDWDRSEKIGVERLVGAFAGVRLQPHQSKTHYRKLHRASGSAGEVDQRHGYDPRIVGWDSCEGGVGNGAIDCNPCVDAIVDTRGGRAVHL